MPSMIHLKIFTFLALLCVLSSAQFFKPPTDFDINQILDTTWYELFYFDNLPVSSPACSSFQFTPDLDSNQIFYKYSFNLPIIRGPLFLYNYVLTPTDNSRVFEVTGGDTIVERQFNILDYAEDHSWVVIGDTGSKGQPWVNVIVKSVDNDNSAGISTVEAEAAKYGLETKHTVTHSDSCPYAQSRSQLFQKEQFDIQKILDVKWYELAWFNNFEDSTPVVCSFFEFSQSTDPNKIFYQYYYYLNAIQGDPYSSSYFLTPTDANGIFDVIDTDPVEIPIDRQFNILDYAEDYSWIVIGDTGSEYIPWVNVLVRDLDRDNSAGIISAEGEAAKYGLNGRHYVAHGDTCPYGEDTTQQEEANEELVN